MVISEPDEQQCMAMVKRSLAVDRARATVIKRITVARAVSHS